MQRGLKVSILSILFSSLSTLSQCKEDWKSLSTSLTASLIRSSQCKEDWKFVCLHGLLFGMFSGLNAKRIESYVLNAGRYVFLARLNAKRIERWSLSATRTFLPLRLNAKRIERATPAPRARAFALVSMQRGLKAIFLVSFLPANRAVSMQRGLKETPCISAMQWEWHCLNAKRIESAFLAVINALYIALSQCKEDWKM